MPDIGEGLTEADIIEWLVAVGDEVAVDQTIVEIETAKTTVEITATHAGTVLALGGAPGDTVAVGDVLFVIGDESSQFTVHSSQPQEEGPRSTVHSPQSESGERTTGNGERPRAMPVVRKLAKEMGIDLAALTGTGSGGAITRSDVENASVVEPSTELVAMGRKRKAIAGHMAESWATIPHVTVQADIRAEAILTARKHDEAGPIPVEAIVAEAVLPLLSRFREFNAVVQGDSIQYRSGYHIGIAVDAPDGLMVVVVRNADNLSLTELSQEIRRLAEAARNGSLLPEEAVGQTFTISNIGALGGGHGTPIIPMGTSAILSIGRARSAPVVEQGALSVGLVAPIDLSYDHRLIDGSLGQRFLSSLVESLESMPEHKDESTP